MLTKETGIVIAHAIGITWNLLETVDTPARSRSLSTGRSLITDTIVGNSKIMRLGDLLLDDY